MHAKAVKMRTKIKDQQKGKQLNKQSLVRPNMIVPSGVAILSRGRDVVWRRRRLFVVPLDVRCCVLGRVFGFNHKIMINV
jgi:hypothetical protein